MPFTSKARIVGPHPRWLTAQAAVVSPGTGVGAVIEFPPPAASGLASMMVQMMLGNGGPSDVAVGAPVPWRYADPATGRPVDPNPNYVRKTVGETPYVIWIPVTASGRPLPTLRSAIADATTVATGGIWDGVATTIPDGAITWLPMAGASGYVTTGRRGVATVTNAWVAPPAGFVAEAVRFSRAPAIDPSPPTSALDTFATLFPALVPGTTAASWTSTNGAIAGPTPETSNLNCWAVYYRHIATGQRRLLRLYEFIAQAETTPNPDSGIDPVNQAAVGATANAAFADWVAKAQARIDTQNAGKFVISLPSFDYGERTVSLKAWPSQEIVMKSAVENIGAGIPGARFTRLIIDAAENISFSFLNCDRDGQGFASNVVYLQGAKRISVRYCNVRLMAEPVGGFSTLYTTFVGNGLKHMPGGVYTPYGIEIRAKNGVLCDDIVLEANSLFGQYAQGIGGAMGDRLTMRRNVHNNVLADDIQFVQGTAIVEEENWFSRDIHPSYYFKSDGSIDISHGDMHQYWASWYPGENYVWDGLIARRNVGLTRSVLSGTTLMARQGLFTSNSFMANTIYEGNIIATQHPTAMGFGRSGALASGNIARYNTMLPVIDFSRDSNGRQGSWIYQTPNLVAASCIRNVYATSFEPHSWMPERLRIPVTDYTFTAIDDYYNSARRASSFYDYRPKAGASTHYATSGDRYGAYETFERVIEGKTNFPKAGPARALWEATYNHLGQIAA